MEQDYSILDFARAAEPEPPEPPPSPEPAPEPAPEPPASEPSPTPEVEEPQALNYADYNEREKRLIEELNALQAEKLRSAPPPTPPPPPQQPPALRNFFEGLDFDESLSSAENMNKVFHVLCDYILEAASNRSAESAMRAMPELINRHMMVDREVREFFAKNPDLDPFQNIMGATMNKVAAEQPDWQLSQILTESAGRVRKMMSIKTPPKPQTPAKRPAFVNGGNRGRVQGVQLTGLEKEVMELIS